MGHYPSFSYNLTIKSKFVNRNYFSASQVKELCTHRIEHKRAKEAYEGLLKEKDKYLGVVLEWGIE